MPHEMRGLVWMRLVIVGVFLLLLVLVAGLLLPVLISARDAAARVECRDNLKIIGLGLHNYMDQQGHLPQGTLPNAHLPPEERLSWMVAILPYVDGGSNYHLFDLKAGWSSDRNRPHARVRTFYNCSSPERHDNPDTKFVSSYIGIAGVGRDAAMLPVKSPQCGVFGYERTIKLDDFKDGLSNTLAVMETSADLGLWTSGGPATVRGLDTDRRPYVGDGRPFGTFHYRCPIRLSGVPPVANALTLDGHVQSFGRRSSPRVLEAMATIAGADEVFDE